MSAYTIPTQRKSKGLAAALSAILLVFILTLAPSPADTQAANIQPELLTMAAEQPDTAVRVIIQQSANAANLEEAITRLGGRVVQDLHFIQAVAVELPAKALLELADMPSVNWVSLDRPLMSAQIDEGVSFYLQNDPFPANGDTVSQAALPLSTVPPTGAELFNFDTNRDASPGLLIAKGGSGYAETDSTKIQRWQLATSDGDLQLSGEAVLTVFAAMKDFQTGQTGQLQAYLLDWDGSQAQLIANNAVTNSTWDGGWQPLTINFGLLNYAVPAGHQLELALLVDGNSDDDMWLAYGTDTHFSNLTIGQVDLITSVRDEFNNEAHDNNDGSKSWASNWIETNDDGTPDGPNITIETDSGACPIADSMCLEIDADLINASIEREVDLSQATSATLTFDYRIDYNGAAFALEASNDGGANWTNLGTYTTAVTVLSESIDLGSYLSANTRIRFRVTDTDGGANLNLDNVEISYAAGGSPAVDSAPPAANPSQIFRDEFSQISFDNNDGTMKWSDSWTGYDYGGGGASGGYVYVHDGRLTFHYAYAHEESRYRSADLSGFTQATLSFDWQTQGLDSGETISILVSQNGQQFTELAAYGGSQTGSANFDISEYIGSATTIRFENRSSHWEYGEYAYFDNVQIEAVDNASAPPNDPTPTAPPPTATEPPVTNDRIIRDDFSSLLYSGNNGTVDWNAAWQEINEDNGPGSGLARVVSDARCASGYCSRLGAYADDDYSFGSRGLSREADLSGAASATLTFDYQRRGAYGSANVTLAISGDGGVSWTDLAAYALNSSDSGPIAQSFDISAFMAANTQIRFVGTGTIPEESSTYIYIDNVQIETSSTLTDPSDPTPTPAPTDPAPTPTPTSPAPTDPAPTPAPTDPAPNSGADTIRDEFNAAAYDNNDGDVTWENDWIENDVDGVGPLAGLVAINNGELFLHDGMSSNPSLAREANLSGALKAAFSFDFRTGSGVEANEDRMAIEVSSDGGSTYTTLEIIDNIAGAASGSKSYDITDYATADTMVRIRVHESYGGSDEYFAVDNVQIEYPPDPTDNHYLNTTNVQPVWDMGLQGQGVTVAVIDSGISPNLDFGNRLIAQVSFNADAQSVNDSYGHGTHVAGIIGGNGANSNGFYQGIAPQVNLIGLKVSDDNGMAYESDTAAAMQWVFENKDLYNIRVVNLSLNSTLEQSYHDSPLDLASELLWFNGVVVVASAGNRSLDGNFYTITASPANDPFIITVGASTEEDSDTFKDDDIALFSAHGTTVDGFVKPDIIAPGYNIVSVLSADSDWDMEFQDRLEDDGDYFRLSGTSMAAPIVSGAAALLLQDEPNLTPDQVKYRLMNAGNTIVPVWFDAILDKTVYPYLDVNTAVTATTTESANQDTMPHMSLAQMALIAYWANQNDAETIDWANIDWSAVNWDNVDWDGVDWASVNWGSVNWGSVNWGSVNWGSVNWGSVNWGSVNWGSVNWGSVNWGSVNWGSVNWGSVNWGSVSWDD